MRFEGAWTALITPFTSDGQVDWDGLKQNFEFQAAQGISGVVPVGTTGESPTLNWQEHNDVIDRVIEWSKDRCGVIAGTGSNSTNECLASTRHAHRSGAQAVLMVDCYYNGPSSRELRDEYYKVVAEAHPDVFIIPYVIPGRSSTVLLPEDLAILAANYKNIRVVKEATGDLERMAKTRELCGDDFDILSGDDDLTFTMLTDPRIKAQGVISVITNVAPGPVQRMVTAAQAGQVDEAAKLKDALTPLFSIVTVKVDNERVLPNGRKVTVSDKYRNPVAIKVMMNGLGLPSGSCRQPLGKMSAAGISVVRNAVKTVWDKNPEILKPAAEFYGVDFAARISDDSVWQALTLD